MVVWWIGHKKRNLKGSSHILIEQIILNTDDTVRRCRKNVDFSLTTGVPLFRLQFCFPKLLCICLSDPYLIKTSLRAGHIGRNRNRNMLYISSWITRVDDEKYRRSSFASLLPSNSFHRWSELFLLIMLFSKLDIEKYPLPRVVSCIKILLISIWLCRVLHQSILGGNIT